MLASIVFVWLSLVCRVVSDIILDTLDVRDRMPTSPSTSSTTSSGPCGLMGVPNLFYNDSVPISAGNKPCVCRDPWWIVGSYCDRCRSPSIKVLNDTNSFRCVCPATNWAIECDPGRCIQGTLTHDNGKLVCRCRDGYRGRYCQLVGCVNGVWDAMHNRCHCHMGWLGEKCQSHRCLNGGSPARGTLFPDCDCPVEWKGRLCQVPRHPVELQMDGADHRSIGYWPRLAVVFVQHHWLIIMTILCLLSMSVYKRRYFVLWNIANKVEDESEGAVGESDGGFNVMPSHHTATHVSAGPMLGYGSTDTRIPIRTTESPPPKYDDVLSRPPSYNALPQQDNTPVATTTVVNTQPQNT